MTDIFGYFDVEKNHTANCPKEDVLMTFGEK